MDVVRARQAARRQGAHPGRDRVQVEFHRASRADRPAARPVRQAGRPGECHGRQRLRLRHLGRASCCRSGRGLGEDGRPGGRRPNSFAPLLELVDGVTGRPARSQAASSLRRYGWRARSRLATWSCGKLVVPQTDGVTDSESGNPACSKHHRGTTMSYYAGIDVSLEQSSVCVLDGEGKIIREAKVASEPEALIAWFGSLGLAMTRIGLEAGPLSQWLFAAMKQAGLPVELLETRHVRNAFKTMPVKTDRKDARGIAELMRMGWFRPVHCKSISAQETRAILTTRTLIEAKLRDVEMSLRGVLRGFGLKVGKTTPTNFAERIKQLVSEHSNLQVIADALLAVREVLLREFRSFEKRVRTMARHDERARLLMTTTGVGAV